MLQSAAHAAAARHVYTQTQKKTQPAPLESSEANSYAQSSPRVRLVAASNWTWRQRGGAAMRQIVACTWRRSCRFGKVGQGGAAAKGVWGAQMGHVAVEIVARSWRVAGGDATVSCRGIPAARRCSPDGGRSKRRYGSRPPHGARCTRSRRMAPLAYWKLRRGIRPRTLRSGRVEEL